MKSLEELKAIRERMQSQVSMRAEDHSHTRVVVGMATCGIASGARPVLTKLSTLVQEKNLTDKISVTQTGCIGLCHRGGHGARQPEDYLPQADPREGRGSAGKTPDRRSRS